METLERPVHHTGERITGHEMASIKRAMEPSIEMNLSTGMTITTPGDPRKGLEVLQSIAAERGLPELLPTYNYCLDGDEIVCFEDALPSTT